MELSRSSSPAREPDLSEGRPTSPWTWLGAPLGVIALFIGSLLAFGWFLAELNLFGEARLVRDPISTYIRRELVSRQALAIIVPAAMALLIWRTSPRLVRQLAVTAGALLLCLQLTEHRIYGPVILEQRQASAKEQRVVALQAPNLLITDDGEALPLDHFEFTAEALALTPAQIATRLGLAGDDLMVTPWPPPHMRRPIPGDALETDPERQSTALARKVLFDEAGPRKPPSMLFPVTLPASFRSDVARDLWSRGLATWRGKTWDEVTGPRR